MKEKHKHLLPLNYDIKLISKASSDRVYKDVIILTAGDWSDSMTKAPVRYNESILRKYSKNWLMNFLNLDHSFETLKRIGWVENQYYRDGKLMGDIRISTRIHNGREAIAHIDAGLVNGLSVEVMSNDKWDSRERVRLADELDFIGCAVTILPADYNTRIIK